MYGAVAYSNWLSEIEGLTPCYDTSDWSCDFSSNGYRLPTEMEWMFAAKGGNEEPATGYNQWAGTNVEALIQVKIFFLKLCETPLNSVSKSYSFSSFSCN